MANNLSGGYGLRPIGLTGSAANTTGTTQYEIASNNTNAIFQGGIVIPTAAGVIDITDQAVSPLGVFYGVEYVDSGTKKTTFKNFGRDQTMSVLIQTSLLRRLYTTIQCNYLLWLQMERTQIERQP